jgi:hypothetical protein
MTPSLQVSVGEAERSLLEWTCSARRRLLVPVPASSFLLPLESLMMVALQCTSHFSHRGGAPKPPLTPPEHHFKPTLPTS